MRIKKCISRVLVRNTTHALEEEPELNLYLCRAIILEVTNGIFVESIFVSQISLSVCVIWCNL